MDDNVLSQIKTPDNLRAYCDDNLEKRGRDRYVCPACGSGTGPRHTAAFSITPDGHWHCFSCGDHGDVLDLIGRVEGIEGYGDRLDRAKEIFGIAHDEPARPVRRETIKPTPRPDYTEGRDRERAYIAKMQENIAMAGEYLEGRGWTVGEAKACGLGYDPQRKRLVIPWAGADYYHIDRDVTDTHPHKYEKPRTSDVGPQPVYNPLALESRAFIVVEGALDAMAVVRCGIGEVVALGGTATNTLLDELKGRHYQGCVILALDGDKYGRATQAKFAKQLKESGITAIQVEYPEGVKDADELYRDDCDKARAFFAQALERGMEQASEADHTPNMRLRDPLDVAMRIYNDEDGDEPISTGLRSLDAMIGGGLMRGLYVIGATSSFGKTTITSQIADAIAVAGNPVLFVTIEQSAQEIVAKSLSRYTHDEHRSHTGGLSAQEITTSSIRKTWDGEKWALLASATNTYTDLVAPNLRILEAVARPTVADVRAAAETMTVQYGRAPVVMVDYLQLLAPRSERDTDKQAVDYNVTALRIMARDLKTPVWCVATLNRESYSGPVDLDSFKESGSIEYGADYAFGLQPRGIAAEVEGVKSAVEKKLKGNAFVAKAKRPENTPRRVELTVLKNRQGDVTGSSKGIPLLYWPRTNVFFEG